MAKVEAVFDLESTSNESRDEKGKDALVKAAFDGNEEHGELNRKDSVQTNASLKPKAEHALRTMDNSSASQLPSDNTTKQHTAKTENGPPVKPDIEPTPEQLKRLKALRTKRTTLSTTLTNLADQETLLLHRLASALPSQVTSPLSLSPPSDKPYMPSTHAHTIPTLPPIPNADKDVLMKNAHAIIKKHIKLLHEYNEIKDVAQGLIGMIADARGVRVVDCQGEFGVGDGD